MAILRIILLTICLFLFTQCVHSQIPATKTFTFINSGELVYNSAEYGASYREVRTPAYNLSTFPFTLCFYNSTPGKYILAIRGGVRGDTQPNRWVWEANRGRPVGEKATLTLRPDGNLVLEDPDGTIAWEAASVGAAGIKLLENGNLILHDASGNPLWQSFDHPADVILAGMSLKNGVTRVVSRKSAADPSEGRYSIILEDPGLSMYLNQAGQLIRYDSISSSSGDTVTFTVHNVNPTYAELTLTFEGPWRGKSNNGSTLLDVVHYDTKYHFLRLTPDGDVYGYAYVATSGGWIQVYTLFSGANSRECQLPSKCGEFGVCDENKCVSCPSPTGASTPWTPKCAPPQLGRCEVGEMVRYYKVNARHFLTWTPEAVTRVRNLRECRERCSRDCNCKGFGFYSLRSECLTVPVIATLLHSSSGIYSFYVKY